MGISRLWHTATLLPSGMVFVVGGRDSYDSPPLANTLLSFDPISGVWYTNPPMATGRSLHTATLLPNGKVLVTGGMSGPDSLPTNSAELYDPLSGWSPTASLSNARYGHTATLLLNGKVLVVGGYFYDEDGGYYLASAQLYDPASGTWSTTGSLGTGRTHHTATLLPSGMVLVTGGYNYYDRFLDSADLYDPASGTWSPAGLMSNKREHHTATLLPNGKVLVGGGYFGDQTGSHSLASAELYGPNVIKVKLPRLLAFYPFDFGCTLAVTAATPAPARPSW